MVTDNNHRQGKKILHVRIRLMIDSCRLNEANKQARSRARVNVLAPMVKLPASRLRFRPSPAENAGYWHTQLTVPLIRG